MRVTIKPSTPHGSVCAPPSKSMAHRMLICAGLALKSEPSLIFGLEDSQDILATIDCLNVLGAGINRQNDCCLIFILSYRHKVTYLWHVAYFSTLSRSWHATAPLLSAYAS